MATSNPRRRRQLYRLGIVLVLVAAAGVGAILGGVATADATSTVAMNDLTIPDANETVDGNVSDVTVQTDVSYSWMVPDAERVVVTLKAGPSASELETVTFQQLDDPAGDGSGTMQLGGSLTELTAYSASDFDPALASTEQTDLVVGVEIEVRRPNDPAVTSMVTEPVSVSVTDGTELTATVGGTGNVSVATAN